ncbi:MAG: universal stress protein [Gammaproteobacteria bacterium]|nr:universal stress protein [Gammaproteobacteria bacterium]
MYSHILVPTEGTRLSAKAVKAAIKLASALGARLTAVHVIAPYVPPIYTEGLAYVPIDLDPKQYKRVTEKNAKALIEKTEQLARAGGVMCSGMFLTHPQPWEGILKAARIKRCDAIVMASHGRSGLKALLLGSETSKVLTHSKLPVLVVR